MGKFIAFSSALILLACGAALAKDLRATQQEDEPVFADNVKLYWKAQVIYTSLDNILLPPFPVIYGAFRGLSYNTHLRGIQKMTDLQFIETDGRKLDIVATFDKVEFRNTLRGTLDLPGFEVPEFEIRNRYLISNIKFEIKMEVNEDDSAFRIVSFKQIEQPIVKNIYRIELTSLFEKPTEAQQIFADSLVEHMKNTLLSEIISQAFSQENMNKISAAQHEVRPMMNLIHHRRSVGQPSPANGVLEPDFDYDRFYRLAIIVGAKVSHVCERYDMEEQISSTFVNNDGGESEKVVITLTGGDTTGIEYYRKQLCQPPTCIPPPEGEVTFNFDEVYSTYNVAVQYKGETHNGQMTITQLGHKTFENYHLWCGMLGCFPVIDHRTVSAKGNMKVDLDDIPESLSFLEPQLRELAVEARDKMLDKFARGGIEDPEPTGYECPQCLFFCNGGPGN